MSSDTEVRQLVIYVGTQAKVNEARAQGQITDNDFVVVTDAPEFALQSSVQAINILIPNNASDQNLLATESFVNSSINNLAAYYDTADVQGNPFATKAALIAGPWYNKGSLRTPTQNDYALVSEDETHDDATSRYMYDGVQWVWQYTLNNTTFTQEQIDAINSKATEAKITQIATNTSSIGDLSSLQTTAKTSAVAAINELQTGKQAVINDLSTIRDNASAGKAASETIANYGNIVTHSVNEFATAEQGGKADSAVQGVQINSTDLTPDINNKVNIPKASADTLGVIRIGTGLQIQSNGQVYLVKATEAQIIAKTNNINPIVPDTLNIAIREGLGNNGLTWTDTYKSNARTTIGAVGDVQINGTSITTSGVANIPPAYGSTMGVVSVYDAGYGIKSMSTGQLQIHSGDWAKFTSALTNPNQWLPIVTKDLLLGMKAFLGTTITSSTSNISWNETEKASARNTLDIPDKTIFRDYD